MDDPVSQGIKTYSEPGLFAPSMFFFPNGAASHNAGGAAIGPCDCESAEHQQGREFVGISDLGVFDVEAACLYISEHALTSPPLAVEVQATSGIIEVGGDDEQLPALDALGGTAQSVCRRRVHARELAFPNAPAGLSKQRAKLTLTAVFEPKPHILLDADNKGNIVFVEEIHPICSDELPIRQEGADRRCPKQAQIALHKFDALSGCRITRMVQKGPHERHSKAARDNGQDQDQDVYIARSQLPIRLVQRQQSGAVQVQHLHDQSCGDVTVQVYNLEEALQAAII